VRAVKLKVNLLTFPWSVPRPPQFLWIPSSSIFCLYQPLLGTQVYIYYVVI
jgi:hypothetical protein